MVGAGGVLNLVRDGRASTRSELARQSGLSRSTLAERVQSLLALDLLQETEGGASTGGRPPATLAFNRSAGVVLIADSNGSACHVAACDLGAVPLGEDAYDDGSFADLDARFDALLRKLGVTRSRVRGIGLGVPEPIEPPRTGFDVPLLVDRHVNLMGLGEQWTHWRDVDHVLFVDAGDRIECAIVSGGAVHRGAAGVAGDIGHIQLGGHEDVLCSCGNSGCLEAVAGGAALAARLGLPGLDAVVAHARAGDPRALQAVREAGRAVGEVLAECINFYNPGAIVLGGALATVSQQLLAGVRETAIGRSLPLATRDLVLGAARLGPRAGVIGAAVMVVEHVLAPENVDREVQELRD